MRFVASTGLLLLLLLGCVLWLPPLALGDTPFRIDKESRLAALEEGRPQYDPSVWQRDKDSPHVYFGSPKHCEGLGSHSSFWDPERLSDSLAGSQEGSTSESRTKRLAPRVDFTLVSQCSFNRIWMLRHICKRWSGDIIIAVLMDLKMWKSFQIPLPKECQFTVNEETGKTRTVTILPYKNAEGKTNNHEEELKVLQFYPVNVLRNYALCHVSTSHIFYTDMDLWPSSNLYHRLHLTKRLYPQRFTDAKHATVIPAFALDTSPCDSTTAGQPCENVGNSVPRNFDDLKGCVVRKKCHVFDRHNYEGHATTDYRNWVFSRQKNFRLLSCIRSNRYEPYLVLPASPKTPLFEESFTGYGKNKIQHVVHLRMAGFKFSVLSYAYVIHFPHAKSKARSKWEFRRKTKNVVNEVDLQYQAFLGWLDFTYGKNTKDTPICAKE